MDVRVIDVKPLLITFGARVIGSKSLALYFTLFSTLIIQLLPMRRSSLWHPLSFAMPSSFDHFAFPDPNTHRSLPLLTFIEYVLE
jgi:hypothetical protein